MFTRFYIEESLQAILAKWDGADTKPTDHAGRSGRSRHARRRQNRKRSSAWCHEVACRHEAVFKDAVARLRARDMDHSNAHRKARHIANQWLRHLVHTSWTWASTPDFFGDLWACAAEMGVPVPMRAPSIRLIGPGRPMRHAVLSAVRRIEQRVPYGYMTNADENPITKPGKRNHERS